MCSSDLDAQPSGNPPPMSHRAPLGRLTGVALAFAVLLASACSPSEPAAGPVWREPGTGMEFVWIPGGCYEMGFTVHRDSGASLMGRG